MSEAIATATKTLPEGATVSVSKMNGKRPYVEIRAWREGAVVKMRGDDVAVNNLDAYLWLVVNAINRERARYTAKPPEPTTGPRGMESFVLPVRKSSVQTKRKRSW